MFRIFREDESGAACMLNCVDGERYPLEASKPSEDAWHIIGTVIEGDVLFLLLSSDFDGYVLDANVTCFPNGFNMRTKWNLKIRDIHISVPKYEEKLEKSMDRYFDRMDVGKVVKRAKACPPLPNALVEITKGF